MENTLLITRSEVDPENLFEIGVWKNNKRTAKRLVIRRRDLPKMILAMQKFHQVLSSREAKETVKI